MKRIPKSAPWEATLADLRHQYAAAVDDNEREVLQGKITSLERAIAIRNGLSASTSPKGSMQFSL